MFTSNRRFVWAFRTAAMLLCTVVWVPAHAYRSAACLLAGKVEQVHQQPLSEMLVRLRLQNVYDNNTYKNEVECAKVFRAGALLYASLHTGTLPESAVVKEGERIWLSLRYLHHGNTVLRKYEWISRKAFLEQKDGVSTGSE